MKRAGRLYHRISGYENLRLAFWKAAKGKQNRREVIEFRADFDANIRKIQEQIRGKEPDIGHYHFFEVRDPKPRSICAASFPERVLHHAIMNIFEPCLESYAIFDSYACRKGKGSHKALARARKYAKHHPWFLKLDIRRYFDSIDHEIMMRLLARRTKDKDVLSLFRKLLNTYCTDIGKGMPIGNLISQHLANFYLGLLDHYLKEVRRIHGYLRYMDDFILFGQEKAHLKIELNLIKYFLSDNLALELKDDIQLNRSVRGIPFLGFRVFPYDILLSKENKKRFSKKMKKYEKKWVDGEWSMKTLVRHMEPLIDFSRVADSTGFRRYVIKRSRVPS